MLHRLTFPLALLLCSAPMAPNVAAAAEAEAATTAKPKAKKDSALATFKTRHQAVIRLVHKDAKAARLQREVDKLLDYEWLAHAALGGPKRFEKRCAPRCEEFQSLLARLIRENYLKRIRLADKGKIEYLGEQRRPKASKVDTKVEYKRDGRPQELEIAYVMHKVDGRWQVRDIITDGVSLARNYKYEFNKILREHGIDGLIDRLQRKLSELAKND